MENSNQKYDWNNVLNDLVTNYNNTFHTTIKAIPNDVKNGKDKNNQETVKIPSDFKVGDKVRVMTKKEIFDKGDKPRFSKGIYHVSKVEGNKFFVTNADNVELKKFYKHY